MLCITIVLSFLILFSHIIYHNTLAALTSPHLTTPYHTPLPSPPSLSQVSESAHDPPAQGVGHQNGGALIHTYTVYWCLLIPSLILYRY
jgi:hypothetical protein